MRIFNKTDTKTAYYSLQQGLKKPKCAAHVFVFVCAIGLLCIWGVTLSVCGCGCGRGCGCGTVQPGDPVAVSQRATIQKELKKKEGGGGAPR